MYTPIEVKSVPHSGVLKALTSYSALGLMDLEDENKSWAPSPALTTQRTMYDMYCLWVNGCRVDVDESAPGFYTVTVDDLVSIRRMATIEYGRYKDLKPRTLFREVIRTYTGATMSIELICAAWQYAGGRYKPLFMKRFAKGIEDISPLVPVYQVEELNINETSFKLATIEATHPEVLAMDRINEVRALEVLEK